MAGKCKKFIQKIIYIVIEIRHAITKTVEMLKNKLL